MFALLSLLLSKKLIIDMSIQIQLYFLQVPIAADDSPSISWKPPPIGVVCTSSIVTVQSKSI